MEYTVKKIVVSRKELRAKEAPSLRLKYSKDGEHMHGVGIDKHYIRKFLNSYINC